MSVTVIVEEIAVTDTEKRDEQTFEIDFFSIKKVIIILLC